MNLSHLNKVLTGAVLLLACLAHGALATPSYTDHITQVESSGNYAACNCTGGTAAGRYQFTAGTLQSLGITQYNGGPRGSWSSYSFTSYAQGQGVNSLSQFLNSSSGHSLQDSAFNTFTTSNWNAMNSTTQGLVGQSVNGVAITQSGLLSAAHFLGAGGLNNWVNSGFDPTIFSQQVLKQNGFANHAELQAYLLNRIAKAGGSTYTPGAGGPGSAPYEIGGTYEPTNIFPGFGPKRPILIRETPPFQGDRPNLGNGT